jgi:pyruvate dehydrogenase (quinone)
MAKTVGDFVLARLRQWGVKRLFGYPGDGINGLLSALGRRDGALDFVQVPHDPDRDAVLKQLARQLAL